MTLLKNDIQLVNFFMDKLHEVAQYVADKIIELNKDTIQKIVYDVYSPIEYERNSEPFSFKNAWDGKIVSSKEMIEIDMYYEPNKMRTHPSVLTGEDVREYLADIIYQGLAGHIFGTGAWTESRNAFEKLGQLLEKSKLDRFIREGAKKSGLKLKRIK